MSILCSCHYNENVMIAPGVLYAILAYTAWGLLPIYWKFFDTISAVEVLCHRIIWSAVFVIGLLVLQKRWDEFLQLSTSPRLIKILLVTASLLSLNWVIYIYAVNIDRVVETSLGYFINPLFSVLLGFIFLKEKLRFWQIFAVTLAAIGVVNFIVDFGQIPWIAFGLTLTFGNYALIRKVTPVVAIPGLALETLLITPLALMFIGYGAVTGNGHFGPDIRLNLLFMGCGIMTSMPLLWFTTAAKHLRLSTLGFLQYLSPSLQLFLGVVIYGEPFTQTHVISFGCIWVALAIYSIDSLGTKHAKVE